MPGGFHPFHAGHASLYQDAVKAFPGADVYVTASTDTSERSFPFAIKEKLARVAGVPAGRFVQVKSPFTSEEITSRYDPNNTVLIFVKSQKNSKNGSDPEGPFPAEVDPATGKLPLAKRGKRKGLPVSDTLKYYAGNEKNLQPMSRNRYIAYLPTVPFGPGIKSGSEFRALWDKFTKVLLNPKSTPEQKAKATELKKEFVTNMYPATRENPRLAVNVVKLMDKGMSNPLTNKSDLVEGLINEFVPPSSGRGDGGGENERSRRLRQLLKIAIQVAEEQNVGTMGKILAMNTIAGDDFFRVAVEGLLPDITDREYMFVIESAYNTVKQGLTEFVTPASGDDREPDEEVLRQLAAQWWNGTSQQMAKAQRTLELMGWEIGQDESGDEDAGVFVIRAGDENGDSYIAFPHSELSLDDINEDYLDEN